MSPSKIIVEYEKMINSTMAVYLFISRYKNIMKLCQSKQTVSANRLLNYINILEEHLVETLSTFHAFFDKYLWLVFQLHWAFLKKIIFNELCSQFINAQRIFSQNN